MEIRPTLPGLKELERDSDFMNDPPSLHFPSFLVNFTHFSANVSCVNLFVFLFSSVYPIFCVSVASEYLFVFSVLQCVKMNGFTVTRTYV